MHIPCSEGQPESIASADSILDREHQRIARGTIASAMGAEGRQREEFMTFGHQVIAGAFHGQLAMFRRGLDAPLRLWVRAFVGGRTPSEGGSLANLDLGNV